nr:UDP-glycosyltransferase UGT5-like [Cherax quadricarinatus]
MRLLVVLFLPTILIAALAGCRMVEAKLPPPDKSYKFLVAIPAVRRNHWNMFKPLLIALANRGHKVVTIQTMAAAFTHPNITEVVVPVPSTTIASRFDVLHDPAGAMVLLEVYLVPLVSRFYSSPKVMQLYNTRHEFDVVMTDHLFNEIGYPFAVGMPFITLATAGVDPHQSAIMGNVLNPAYVPNAFFNYPRPYSLFDRLHNLYTILHEGGYWRVWGMMPKIQRETMEDVDQPRNTAASINSTDIYVRSVLRTTIALALTLPNEASMLRFLEIEYREILRKFIESQVRPEESNKYWRRSSNRGYDHTDGPNIFKGIKD